MSLGPANSDSAKSPLFMIQGEPKEAYTAVELIVAKNSDLAGFWSQAAGWAPAEAADLLSKSRLDRQQSLSVSLARWATGPHPLSEGDLILAWANLGSLVEGTLKLFLCVYYEDYKVDAEKTKFHKVYDSKTGKPRDPDRLELEGLSQYFKKAELLTEEELSWLAKVQARRNAIHSFRHREIGDTVEFLTALGEYYDLLEGIESRLPYP